MSRSSSEPKGCTIEDCERKAACRTWCWTHYDRWRKNGSPHTLGPRGERGTIIQDPEERFWSKVEKTEGCWLWIGNKGHRGGYGQFHNPNGSTLAHRISYEKAHGPIPDGMVVDHLCREASCVRPDHLEVVTLQENSSRASRNRTSKLCSRGHDQTDPSVRRARKDGVTYCGECANISQEARRAITRAKRAARAWAAANPDNEGAFVIQKLLASL